MTQALQGLLMAGGDCMNATLDGSKLITIREGHRGYRLGPVLIGCPCSKWAHLATITSVRHTTLQQVTPHELADDNFVDVYDAIRTLSQWYPDITTASPVTIIRWENN